MFVLTFYNDEVDDRITNVVGLYNTRLEADMVRDTLIDGTDKTFYLYERKVGDTFVSDVDDDLYSKESTKILSYCKNPWQLDCTRLSKMEIFTYNCFCFKVDSMYVTATISNNNDVFGHGISPLLALENIITNLTLYYGSFDLFNKFVFNCSQDHFSSLLTNWEKNSIIIGPITKHKIRIQIHQNIKSTKYWIDDKETSL